MKANKRYTSWNTKKTHRWLLVAALNDAIYFFKRKVSEEKHDVMFNNMINSADEADKRNIEILKGW